MTSEIYILLFVSIIPIISKYIYWLSIIQENNYSISKIKKFIYISLNNFWFLIELPVFLFFIVYLLNNSFEIVLQSILFYLLVLENIYFLWKFFRKKYIFPKKSFNLLLLILVVISILVLLFNLLNLYLFILVNLIFTPIIILLWKLLTIPILNYIKKKQL
jgi:hypothetical protein